MLESRPSDELLSHLICDTSIEILKWMRVANLLLVEEDTLHLKQVVLRVTDNGGGTDGATVTDVLINREP